MDRNNFYLSYPDPAYQQVQQPWLVHDNLTLQEGRLDLLFFPYTGILLAAGYCWVIIYYLVICVLFKDIYQCFSRRTWSWVILTHWNIRHWEPTLTYLTESPVTHLWQVQSWIKFLFEVHPAVFLKSGISHTRWLYLGCELRWGKMCLKRDNLI